jgi:predicted nucleic acid-binding protein
VLAYLASQALDQLFLSAVTIAEIQYGILNAQTEDRKRQLEGFTLPP